VTSGPVEPRSTQWRFPDPTAAPDDLVCVGADLEPATVLAAYRAGLFPMPYGRRRIGWWSPNPRGILPLDGLKLSRSLRRSQRRYEVRVDGDFRGVITACATLPRHGGWISPAVVTAYTRLHELGWAHSVEAVTPDGEIAGGLYGVALGGLFAGESMFHRATDASKVALVGLVEQLRDRGFTLLDVQWATPHLSSLGVVEISRRDYLARLGAALAQPVGF
jgi:leucyl/phenylalanyl-tRNA--protein transferase